MKNNVLGKADLLNVKFKLWKRYGNLNNCDKLEINNSYPYNVKIMVSCGV